MYRLSAIMSTHFSNSPAIQALQNPGMTGVVTELNISASLLKRWKVNVRFRSSRACDVFTIVAAPNGQRHIKPAEMCNHRSNLNENYIFRKPSMESGWKMPPKYDYLL